MVKRSVYLESVTWQEAYERFVNALGSWPDGLAEHDPSEVLKTVDALGRILYEPVVAKHSWPHYHAAAMDGYAVRSELCFGISETRPVRLTIGSEAREVDTGDPMPEGFDAVVMIEDVHRVSDDQIEIIQPVSPWQYVRQVGEDIVATELLFPAGHELRPVDLGALLAGGVTSVRVRKMPVVGIIPTGDELVPPEGDIPPGRIPEFNSVILAGLVTSWGGKPQRYDIVPDEVESLRRVILEVQDQCDIVVVNAGSSAGSEDFTYWVLQELGEVNVHGVAIRPGKPVILAKIGSKPAIGLPGYPVSMHLTADLFLKPLIYKFLGKPVPVNATTTARLAKRTVSPMGIDEFIRVKVGKVGDRVICTPISRGAGLVSSLVRADGVMLVPRSSEGYEEGQEVSVELYRPFTDICNTITAIGSHDVALDVLGGMISQRFPGTSLSSAHVGSLGGILALKKGEAHIAGIHLLDEETGEYNTSYVKRFLPGRAVVLLTLVGRTQGLMVKKGNPRGMKGFSDLARKDVVFVNRQRGAGTRLLLDHRLKQEGIDPKLINGYERELYTHMAVASAVKSGTADVGLGILAAARSLDLDFMPVAQEQYELAIPREFMELDMIKQMIEVINSSEFKSAVSSLGGYDVSVTGRVRGIEA